MNRREYNEFVNDNYRKNEKLIVIGGVSITAFELVFAIISILKPNDSPLAQVLYLTAYFALFGATLLMIVFCCFCKKWKYYKDVLPTLLHVYDFIISVWAIAISLLDVYRGSYPIVFVTVMFTLPFFLKLHFIQNTIIVGLGLGGLLAESTVLKGYFSVGYSMNLIVFAFMAGLVSVLSYRTTVRNYRLENVLHESSIRDGLTKLFNRGALDDKLEEVSKGQNLYNVVMLDCDDFKQINDHFGHRIGDEALVKIAELLQREFGENCYRYGGDEFVVVATFTANTIKDSIKQMNAELKEHFGDIPVQVSAGIYQIENGSSVENIISCVDSALYEAKNTQKGTVSVYKR